MQLSVEVHYKTIVFFALLRSWFRLSASDTRPSNNFFFICKISKSLNKKNSENPSLVGFFYTILKMNVLLSSFYGNNKPTLQTSRME